MGLFNTMRHTMKVLDLAGFCRNPIATNRSRKLQ